MDLYWLIVPVIVPVIGGVVGVFTYDWFVTRILPQQPNPDQSERRMNLLRVFRFPIE